MPLDHFLANVGITNPLPDPTLALRDSNGNLAAFNDNWQDSAAQATQLEQNGVAPISAQEAGIVASFPPGAYTAIVSDRIGRSGVALVEVYSLEVN